MSGDPPSTRPADVRAPTSPPLAAPACADEAPHPAAWRVAIDRGGTFTDIVARGPGGRVVSMKVPTDPRDALSDAAVAAIRSISGAPAAGAIPARCVSEVRIGTTAATNALLERRGERCALLVTKGFRDLLTIGTQERPDLFALRVLRTLPLPELTYEIGERVLADGTVRTPLDEGSVAAARDDIAARGIRSVAVLLLHAYAHPPHELRVRAILHAAAAPRRLDVFLSHESACELGAVARGETTAADAYLTPVLRRSLALFRAAFAPDVAVRCMRSDGGLTPVADVRGPAAVLSGPAGGALAVERIARSQGIDAAVGFDMGGTSTDVCRAGPAAERRYETRVAGFRLRVPSLRVHTVAAGGGSVLAFDGRKLVVGPESAGAHPGPAGYGRGGPPTLTDADAVLGRLVPSEFPRCFGPDGTSAFDVGASRRAIEPLAAASGLTVEEAALGFVRVADERVAQAIREESVLRGHDVRTHTLVAFGGAGAQHACAVARALDIRRIVVPRLASVLSAWGIAGAREAREAVVPLLRPLDDAAVSALMLVWIEAGRRADEAHGGRTAAHELRMSAELRVRGTDATLAVSATGTAAEIAARFRQEHARAYGFDPPPGAEIEVVNVRVRVEYAGEPPPETAAPAAPRRAPLAVAQDAWFVGGNGARRHLTPVTDLDSHAAGDRVDGPALVVSPSTTIVVEPGWRLTVDPSGAFILERVVRVPPPRITAERDPVSLALFANTYMSVAERMGSVLERTSHSTNIKERLDFSCAVFDGEGRLVANAPHIPVHLGAMGESVRAVIAARGTDLREGDCIVTNDPYRGGSHLPDVTVVTPVLVEDGRAAFFVANRAHHADVGGITPGSMPPHSRSIDEEGVRLHDVLLVRDGTLREDAIRAALAAGPYPARAIDERLFDFRAQAAANREVRRSSWTCAASTVRTSSRRTCATCRTTAPPRSRRSCAPSPAARTSPRTRSTTGRPSVSRSRRPTAAPSSTSPARVRRATGT